METELYAAYTSHFRDNSLNIIKDILKYCSEQNINFNKLRKEYDLHIIYDLKLIRTDFPLPNFRLANEDIVDDELRFMFKVKGLDCFTTKSGAYYDILGVVGYNGLLDSLAHHEISLDEFKEYAYIIENFYKNNKFYNCKKMNIILVSKDWDKLLDFKNFVETHIDTTYNIYNDIFE